MAHYSGYVSINVSSYDAFKTAVNGNSYDADGIAGCQCVDLAKEINYNLGYSSPYWDTGGTGSAYGGWSVTSARTYNAWNKYTLVYDKTQIKRGDMIVFNYFSGNPYGHVGFADENYNGTNTIRILSQNNGGTPAPGGGTTVNVANYSLNYFLGAFRLTAWNDTPTPINLSNTKFPWVLLANKLREKY